MRSEKVDKWNVVKQKKSKVVTICKRQQEIESQILPGNEVALENLATDGAGEQVKEQ